MQVAAEARSSGPKQSILFSIIKLKQQITSRNQSVNQTESQRYWRRRSQPSPHRHCLLHCRGDRASSAESPGFSLGLKQGEDVVLPDWSLHVSNEGSVLHTDEGDLNLCNTSSGAYRLHKTSQRVHTPLAQVPRGRWRGGRLRGDLPVLPMTSSTVAYMISAESMFSNFSWSNN